MISTARNLVFKSIVSADQRDERIGYGCMV